MPYCPCCQRESREFAPFGVTRRPRAKCPRCGSLERDRLLWLFLSPRPHLLAGTQRLLHIAPDPVMADLFKSVPGIRYISADLMAATDVRLDITALPFADGSLDAVVCNHVLEHVPNDRAAMCEFRRVLSPRGWARTFAACADGIPLVRIAVRHPRARRAVSTSLASCESQSCGCE